MKINITYITGVGGAAADAMAQTARVAQEMGCHGFGIYNNPGYVENEGDRRIRVDGIIASMAWNDVTIFQFPTWCYHPFDMTLMEQLKLYGKHTIVFVHDIYALLIDELTPEERIQRLAGEIAVLNQADLLILASEKLHHRLQESGLINTNVMYQTIWDYITDYCPEKHEQIHRMIFTGNDDLSFYEGNTPIHQFCYDEPQKTEHTNVEYKGYMESSDLLHEMAHGGFGLVYANDELFYRYDCMNQPYKLGVYLASGIPVIVRKGCVHEQFIRNHGLGFVVESLDEADELVNSITDEEYNKLYDNIKPIQKLITSGFYTRRLLSDAIIEVMEK